MLILKKGGNESDGATAEGEIKRKLVRSNREQTDMYPWETMRHLSSLTVSDPFQIISKNTLAHFLCKCEMRRLIFML